MRTTINDLIGRKGGDCGKDELERVLTRARRILADVSAFTELELDRLMAAEIETEDEERVEKIQKLIAETRKTMSMVVDLEAKVGLSLANRPGEIVDLEEARAEILDRLSSLVA